MILLDTTVLIYAVGDAHPLRAPCRRVLAAHAEGRIEATTIVQVIEEVAHVRSRRKDRADAVALATRLAEAFEPLSATSTDLLLGLELFERYTELSAFDAVLAAVALNRQVEALVSGDPVYALVPGLRWCDPLTSALDTLLGERA